MPRSIRESLESQPLSGLVLIPEALLQQDPIDVEHHPVIELPPLAVLRPELGLDQLRDLLERERAACLLRRVGYCCSQVFKVFAHCRDLRFWGRGRAMTGHDAVEIEGFDLA